MALSRDGGLRHADRGWSVTTSEACELATTLVREVSAAKASADAWRRVARAAIHHAHDLHVELDRLRDRYYQLLDEQRRARRAA